MPQSKHVSTLHTYFDILFSSMKAAPSYYISSEAIRKKLIWCVPSPIYFCPTSGRDSSQYSLLNYLLTKQLHQVIYITYSPYQYVVIPALCTCFENVPGELIYSVQHKNRRKITSVVCIKQLQWDGVDYLQNTGLNKDYSIRRLIVPNLHANSKNYMCSNQFIPFVYSFLTFPYFQC